MKSIEISHETYQRSKQLFIAYAIGGITVFAILTATERELRHRIVDVADYIASGSQAPEPIEQPPAVLEVESEPRPRGVLPPVEPVEMVAPESEPVDYYGTGTMLPPIDDPFVSDDIAKDMAKIKDLPMLFTDAEVAALIEIESGGDLYLMGDNGNAYGCLQIWDKYLADVNETHGTFFRAEDMLGNRKLSILCMNAYMHRHAPNHSFEMRARVHNKGPDAKKPGHKQYIKANAYWKKAQKAMQTQLAKR